MQVRFPQEAVTAAVLRYLDAVENPRPANTTPPYKYGNSGLTGSWPVPDAWCR